MIKPEILACMKLWELLKRTEFINVKVKSLKKSVNPDQKAIDSLLEEKEQLRLERQRRGK